jgi:hypothetical protein
MEALRRRTSQFGLDMIHINLWEGTNAVDEASFYCDIWSVDGVVLLDETGDYAESLQIRGVPTNVLVDVDGTVTAVTGVRIAELEAEIGRLLGPGCRLEPTPTP